ncbi:hypothetical protein PV10_08347 [Exophiala mesophila]|uniref:Uncharacterized protein n=1 Tax=Exophiala mesophila TaxID=212818 RepID=A0A0D1ZPH4_EXOME|nr:uncharacterized protein PV10_08347 [Exophiala mesophila]KIV88688.1 hypothetical protein PV10_08347 [Exophiala mesophila]
MINLGLSRITSLLQPLFFSHPSLPWRTIHIAGTNGKGSTATYISTLLSHQGYKVGRFTSPHLVHRWDCISLNQRIVDKDVFLAIESEVQKRSREQGINATEFEVLTAVAFELFTRHGMEFGVVECGLGGRLDATNVLREQDVEVAVLTKVGLDHQDFLGDTVKKIAEEKAGIFKTGVAVVVDQSNEPCVLDVVREKVKDVNAGDDDSSRFLVQLPSELEIDALNEPGVKAMNLADHQKQNLTTALGAFYYLMEHRQSSAVAEQHMQSTIRDLPDLIQQSHASIRGRLETLTLPPHLLPSSIPNEQKKTNTPFQVLVDGAHNPQAAVALAKHIRDHIRGPSNLPIIWVMSLKRDKDISTFIKTVVAPGDHVVTCAFAPVESMPWVSSMDPYELAKEVTRIMGGQEHHVEVGLDPKRGHPTVAAAIRRALSISMSASPDTGSSLDDGGIRPDRIPICIAGSLYLVGDVMRALDDTED